jgi:hypothetical protein
MTANSSFKKQVRARMKETGEKYTVARRMVEAEMSPSVPPPPKPADHRGMR